METEKFTAADQLSNLKNLFSRFVDALNDVNVSIFIAISHFCAVIMFLKEQNGACPAEHHSAIDDYVSHFFAYFKIIKSHTTIFCIILHRWSPMWGLRRIQIIPNQM